MKNNTPQVAVNEQQKKEQLSPTNTKKPVAEINGRVGLEPTRYGDWEKNGRCIDF